MGSRRGGSWVRHLECGGCVGLVPRDGRTRGIGSMIGRQKRLKMKASLELGDGLGREAGGFRGALGWDGGAGPKQAGVPEELGPRAGVEPLLGTG